MPGFPMPAELKLKLKASEAPDMRLVLLNRAENVALVRQALAGVADPLGLEAALTDDMKTVVSEACNNVVVHAYGGGEGPLEVYICPGEETLQVVVRDEGGGIQPHLPEPDSGVLGVGLSLIQALTDRVEFSGAAGKGTEVRMVFNTNGSLPDVTLDREAEEEVPLPAGETVLSVCAGALAEPVLGRVVAMLAARAGFSVDRLADAQLVSDAIAAGAPSVTVGRHVHVGLDAPSDTLELRIGPLDPGGGEELVRSSSVAGMPSLLDQLADSVAVEPMEGGEQLLLTIHDLG